MKGILLALLSLLVLNGCAAWRSQKRFEKKLQSVLTEAYSSNEPCTSVCLKLKMLIAEKIAEKTGK